MNTFERNLYTSLVRRIANTLLAVSAIGVMNANAIAQHDHDHEHGHDSGDEPEEHDESHHEEAGPVKLDAETLREFGIKTAVVSSGKLHEEVVLPGEIRFNRERLAYATPRYKGVVQDINVRLADSVTKGEVIAKLENTETLRPFDVVAPFDGTIVAYDVTPGQTVDAGAPLFTIADLGAVWADLQIYQSDLNAVREGQNVLIQGRHDDVTYRGSIAYIAPTIDEHTRTGLARVLVENRDAHWRPGQFIKGAVSIEEHPVDVIIPRSAVLTMEGATIVFVETDEGFEPRSVQLGHSDSESFQVLSGLRAGETIATRNAISLKAEMGKGSFGGHHH